MKGSTRARQALEANLLIEWIDPLGSGSEPCYHQAHARDIATDRRRTEPRYETDEDALEDFMVVNWASVAERYHQMTLPQVSAREELRQLLRYPGFQWDTDQYPTLDQAVLAVLTGKQAINQSN